MACKANNNIDKKEETTTTPKRKRKREPETPLPQGLTNAGFCSTPTRESNTLTYLPSGKERNTKNSFTNSSCLEVKSIAEIASCKAIPENPYEINRKPPKKKKRHDVNEACFTNPALNLEVPDREINPFEVKRIRGIVTESNQCFSNPGLNIRTQENNFAVNPFEITREKIIENSKGGIENPALELPTSLTIAVPFQPTVKCRIDFSGLPIENLTPSKLLAEKLVFTPNNQINGQTGKNFRRSLSVISEEIVDIGKELDCYQLELENSINEAKTRKRNFESRLKDVEESIEQKNEGALFQSGEESTNISSSLETTEVAVKQIESIAGKNINIKENEVNCQENEKNLTDCNDRNSTNEVEIDFKFHTPFVRSYRKPEKQRNVIPSQHEQIIIPQTHIKENEEKTKISNVIRRSFRKLVHKSKFDSQPEKCEDRENIHFFDTLRRSLRRKPKIESKCDDSNARKSKLNENQANNKEEEIKLNDISILDNQERKVFRSISVDDNCTKTDEKKATFRNSFRKSTKEMRNQVLKSVFHRNINEYDLKE